MLWLMAVVGAFFAGDVFSRHREATRFARERRIVHEAIVKPDLDASQKKYEASLLMMKTNYLLRKLRALFEKHGIDTSEL
jgi:hypothetical protein